MRILGLDASTTTIGWCLLEFDENWNLLNKWYGYFNPPKEGHIVERLNAVQIFISDLIDKQTPNEICIEDILLGFNSGGKTCPVCKKAMGGQTTIKTLTSLAVLNRTVCLTVFNKTGKLPNLFSVLKIRHAIKEEKKIPKKEEIPALMEKYLGKFDWKLQTKGKNKGQLDKRMLDISDSIACAYTFKVISQREALKPAKKMKNAKRKVS